MARYCHECGSALHSASSPAAGDAPEVQKKAPRKTSAYGRRYGAEFKRLKAAHPRMKFGALSKKAHAATRKAMR